MGRQVSERLRDQAVRRLRRDYCRGGIGPDTFERRVEAVLTADRRAALRQATRDVAKPSLVARARFRLFPPPPATPSGLLVALAADRPSVIGRSRSCDLVLRDDSVSRRHVMLALDGDHAVVTDLGSTNGTLLNGRWITQAEARPGDVLQLGEIELLL
jgi:pSer/pThr/pTyr-binding forkhead associated (FHA) protein